MKFLEEVAADLLNRYGTNLSRIAVVFPNKRAGNFLNEYLCKCNQGNPIWTPTYFSISEFYASLSELQEADPIRTNFYLYNIAKKYVANAEDFSINYFYSWGQQLLDDFNNIDNNLGDAREILTNIQEIKRYEELNPEIKERLIRIFAPETDTKTRLQEEFEQIWNNLYAIYKELNQKLRQRGEGYNGALKRCVVESLVQGDTKLSSLYDGYCFVGFNVLLNCDKRLFSYMQKEQGNTLFYWDYDQFFLDNSQSFTFANTIKENLKNYPNALNNNLFHNLNKQSIEIVYSSGENVQCRYATSWIGENLTKPDERNTAIILCNENLLQAILHALPEDSEIDHETLGENFKTATEINITKGFPLSQTPAYTFVAKYLDKNLPSINSVLPFLDNLIILTRDEAQKILQDNDSQTWKGILYSESYFHCYTTMIRFREILAENIVELGAQTFSRLLLQILQSINIPFKGEPVTGLQIMGMLETRNLDFDEILMLSVNERNIPKRKADHSFLPYDIRKYWQLTTNEDESEIYAYNFFRLIQRAKHVTFVCNQATTEGGGDLTEPSRFLQQLQMFGPVDIKSFRLQEDSFIRPFYNTTIPQDKVKMIMQGVEKHSPTAILNYISCPMKYYFKNLANIPELDNDQDGIPANTFGSIFHHSACMAYQLLLEGKTKTNIASDSNLKGYAISPSELKDLATNRIKLYEIIENAFRSVCAEDFCRTYSNDESGFKNWLSSVHLDKDIYAEMSSLEGQMTIVTQVFKEHPDLQTYIPAAYPIETNVIYTYLKNLLEFDAKLNNLRIIDMENRYDTSIENLTIGGIIDRLDVINYEGKDVLRIVDYKTGKYNDKKVSFKDIESLFLSENIAETGYIFQTFIYSNALSDKTILPIMPNLIFTQKLIEKQYDSLIKLPKKVPVIYQEFRGDFEDKTKETVKKMRDTEYLRTSNQDACKNCPYQSLCL